MKYLSCRYIEHGMDFEHTRLETCCFTCHSGGGRITLKNEYNGEAIDWQKLFDKKRKYRIEHRKGNLMPNCVGCIFLEEKEWDEEDYINFLQFNYWVACNSKCTYCYEVQNKKLFEKIKPYNTVPIIKEMIDKNILRPGGEVSFGGGEPTIAPEFEELINLLANSGFRNMRIHSSGIKFSPAIEAAIKKGVLNVVVSIDAGCEKTYKKIKNVNAYKKVIENMKKYAQANKNGYGLMTSKYIIIPNVNDNRKEIDMWIDSVVKAGAKWLALDIEDVWYKTNRSTISTYYLDLVNYVINRANELGMKIELYDRARGLKEGKNIL
ncbi:MAG: radical SAM protein [Cyanobacteria bacterium SIG29]|nr:radical SAM protein [Cyanobacteria bacterium SIG29]